MLKQLLKYTMSHPCNYLSGTVIFSELLPLPLPIQVCMWNDAVAVSCIPTLQAV